MAAYDLKISEKKFLTHFPARVTTLCCFIYKYRYYKKKNIECTPFLYFNRRLSLRQLDLVSTFRYFKTKLKVVWYSTGGIYLEEKNIKNLRIVFFCSPSWGHGILILYPWSFVKPSRFWNKSQKLWTCSGIILIPFFSDNKSENNTITHLLYNPQLYLLK